MKPRILVAAILVVLFTLGCSAGRGNPDLSQSPDNLTAVARVKAQGEAQPSKDFSFFSTPAPTPNGFSFFSTPPPTPTPSVWTVTNTGGDGVYIRRTMAAGDKIKAWPDNTPMLVTGDDEETEGKAWKNVTDPDGNVGYVPAEYLAQATPTPAPTPTIDRSRYKLELLATGGERGYGFVTVGGQVKNISAVSLKNVLVLIEWYTASGEFIKSDDALIDYNPILAGQTSPFESITTYNPAMARYAISFKEMFGGEISTLDSRKR